MSKIGVITIVDNKNYGNRLQNYAVMKVYEKMGYEVETLILNPRKGSIKYIPKALRMVINQVKQQFKMDLSHKRIKNFVQFNKRMGIVVKHYPIWSKLYIDKKYSFFSVGSDQIWNYKLGCANEISFLSFTQKCKRISFSPSFGASVLPKNLMDYYKSKLIGFNHISVREQSGAELVYNLTQKKAEVLLDPTMMLTADEWRKISNQSIHIGKKYILKYFLGTEEKKNIDRILDIARLNQYTIIELANEAYPELYCSDPSAFIDFIDHAELICTDSFHACVFAILFNKPFLVFDRDGNGAGMGSRISTLLSVLRLERKMPGCVDDENVFEHDYRNAYKILELERKKAEDFLKRSLRLEDEN